MTKRCAHQTGDILDLRLKSMKGKFHLNNLHKSVPIAEVSIEHQTQKC